MVDSGASSNVMSYFVCQNLNIDPQVHQTINKLMADIPKAYGLMLNRDWSSQLNGYFATDWSHLWHPYKGNLNQIRVNKERYMKHTVTESESVNEPILFINSILENYYVDIYFWDFPTKSSSIPNNTISELLFCTHEPTPRDDKLEVNLNKFTLYDELCTLHFDGSKTKEDVSVKCILIDPKRNKTLIVCRLEFECANNVIAYEALIQALRKEIDLGVKNLKVFGDSKIIVK